MQAGLASRKVELLDYRIVYVGAQSVFAVLFLTHFFLHRINNKGQKLDKLDILYLLFVGTAALDSIWMMIDGRVEYRSVHIVLEVVYLTMMSLTGYDWFLYTLDLFPTKEVKIRKFRYALAIPTILMIALIFLSIKTGWIFSVDQSGKYIRGDFNMVPVVVNYAYMVIGSYIALQCSRDALLTVDKKRFTLAALFPVPILIASAIQLMLPPGLPLMHGGVLVALLMQYGAAQNALATSDYLTGLSNRVAFEQDLIGRIRKFRPDDEEKLYLLEGDIDDFKFINDTYGHSVGDRALIKAADVLSRIFAKYEAAVFRIGGDEFMAIIESEKELDINQIEDEINGKLILTMPGDDINMSMSFGAEKYDESMNIRSFIDSADQKLYKSKEKKQSQRRKGTTTGLV